MTINILSLAKSALDAESEAIKAAATKLGAEFVKAVQAILEIEGKVIVTGLGKSGHVARKLAATLSSTGTPSFYLHPSEALHGDLGMISKKDAVIAVAFGGETSEVVAVAKHAKRLNCFLVSITGKLESSLASLSNVVIDGSVDKEVCPLNLAPTASTSVAMALGDALAVSIMGLRGFSRVDFATLHPGGSLGRKLAIVSDVMRKIGSELPAVTEDAIFHDVLDAVTRMNLGIVPVLNSSKKLVGAISDGDIRRCLQKHGEKALQKKAAEIMTTNPKTVHEKVLALDAFSIMEKNQITSLFVVSENSESELKGIVRMHDLLAAKII